MSEYAFSTGTIVTPGRLRSVTRQRKVEVDSAVGFHITGHTTGTGANYDLFVANHNNTGLINVLCGVNPSHATANRYLVPMTFFTAAGFTNQAGAEAAALAAFQGVNMSAPPAGVAGSIQVARACICEFLVEASTFLPGDPLTFSYDTTNSANRIHPFRLKKNAGSASLTIARVYSPNPIGPKSGNQVRLLVEFDL